MPAWAADVVSSNIVGYSKLDLANGFTMIGSAFQTVGGDKTISVQDIKASGLAGFDWDTFEPGDTLMIWDADQQGYLTTLYYTGDTQTETMTGMGVTAGTWFDMDTFTTSELELNNGDAFWIVGSVANAQVTLCGEVPTEASSVTLVSGFNMLANPYPKATQINDILAAAGLVGFDWDTFEPGDTLMIWDKDQQGYLTTLYYTGDTQTETMTGMGVTAGTWFDMDTFATAETEIPIGGAFWIVTANGGTVQFK